MSQKESLTLAKDMIELQSKELGYSGKWLKAAENSVADEMVLADPFFTPDAYLNCSCMLSNQSQGQLQP
jgi:hypothetical protein